MKPVVGRGPLIQISFVQRLFHFRRCGFQNGNLFVGQAIIANICRGFGLQHGQQLIDFTHIVW